jgi:hypothetical protein
VLIVRTAITYQYLPDGLDNVDRNTNPLKLPSSVTKFYWSWARGPVLIMRTAITYQYLPDGLDNVDRNTNPLTLPSSITKFYWSWARGPVLIVRTAITYQYLIAVLMMSTGPLAQDQ